MGFEREKQDSSQQSMSAWENCILILNSLYLLIYFGFLCLFQGQKGSKGESGEPGKQGYKVK